MIKVCTIRNKLVDQANYQLIVENFKCFDFNNIVQISNLED